jgi:hypothetical protein
MEPRRFTQDVQAAAARSRAGLTALALVAFATIASADAPRWKKLSPPPAMPAPAASGDLAIDDFTLHWAA